MRIRFVSAVLILAVLAFSCREQKLRKAATVLSDERVAHRIRVTIPPKPTVTGTVAAESIQVSNVALPKTIHAQRADRFLLLTKQFKKSDMVNAIPPGTLDLIVRKSLYWQDGWACFLLEGDNEWGVFCADQAGCLGDGRIWWREKSGETTAAVNFRIDSNPVIPPSGADESDGVQKFWSSLMAVCLDLARASSSDPIPK